MNMLNNLSNKLSSNIKVLSAALALTLGSQLSLANLDVQSTEDSVQKGMGISLKTKTVDQGWQDFTADMLMVYAMLKDKRVCVKSK